GPFSVYLGLHPCDLRLQHVDALFQLGHPEQLQVLADRLYEPLTAADTNFRRLFHDGLHLSGSPMGRYPTAQGGRVQGRLADTFTGLVGVLHTAEMLEGRRFPMTETMT